MAAASETPAGEVYRAFWRWHFYAGLPEPREFVQVDRANHLFDGQASIDRAVAAYPDPAAIFERNAAVLRRLGHAGFARILDGEDEPAP